MLSNKRFLSSKNILLTSLLLVCGCVPLDQKSRPNPTPIIKTDVTSAAKNYAIKASEIFAEAASQLKASGDVSAVHDFIKNNLTEARADSYSPIDTRLQAVLGVEEPDIDKGVKLLLDISTEFKEAGQ